jgi:hypothetical protein
MTDAFLRAASHFTPPPEHHASALFRAAGYEPDQWQLDLMAAHPLRALMLCARQVGKSLVVSAMALEEALTVPHSTTLLISPSQRQSAELLTKVRMFALAQHQTMELEQASVLSLRLTNGSRIISLPGKPELIRGYSANLLIIDEAAWVPDVLYQAVRPMLSVANGRLVALSTPWGARGWWHGEWVGPERWLRVKVTAEQCPRITPEFLAEEKRSLPASVYASEYEVEFVDQAEMVFSSDDVRAALDPDVHPLFGTALSNDTDIDEDDTNVLPLFQEA